MMPYSQWRRYTAGGIRYKHIAGPTGSFDKDGSASFREEYIIRKQDLIAFVNESFPLPALSGGFVLWNFPRRMPGTTAVFTKHIDFEPFTEGRPSDPFGADSGAPSGTYEEYLKLTISYEPDKPKDEDDPETFLEISSRSSAEFLTFPSRGNDTWSDGRALKDKDVPVSQVISETEWQISWPKVPNDVIAVLFDRCRPYMGKVNSTPVTVIYNPPAETVLFTGMSFDQQFHATGDTDDERNCGKVSVSFLEKSIAAPGGPYGHNHFYRPGTDAGFYRIIRPDGSYVYQSDNLNAMFT